MAPPLLPEDSVGGRDGSVLESLNTAKNALLVSWQRDPHLHQVPVGEERGHECVSSKPSSPPLPGPPGPHSAVSSSTHSMVSSPAERKCKM